MFDCIAIGDSTFDIFNCIHEARLRDVPRDHISFLEVTYRDKIPVDQFAIDLGGNATNVGVGLQRLGLGTALFAVRGDDCFGEFIGQKLAQEHVDTRYVHVEQGGQSNISTILVYKSDRTIFPYYVPRSYILPDLEAAKLVFFSSGGKGFEQLYEPVVSYTERVHAKLAFNPGPYQLRKNLPLIKKLLSSVYFLLVNKEEGEMILEAHLDDPKELMNKLARLGPSIVVVTDDVRGAGARSHDEVLWIDCFPSEMVEKTGAGDAFSSAFLGTFIGTNSLSESVRAGSINAASVVKYIGAQKGLLSVQELTERMQKHKDFAPKKLL